MKKELLFSITKKDFEVQTFRSGGKGGQHQNKTDSGVRIIHRASGAVGESRSERSQLVNKRLALKRQLTDGDDLESVAKAVALLREIENIQNKSLTYDQAFLLLQNFRHGLNEDITKEEIEELRATFGSELDEE